MDADPLTADSPLSMSSATSMAVESTGLKLSKEEEDYLEKLMAEKKTVDQTAALDLTQKLLNAEIERILNGGKVSGPRDESGHSGKKFCDVTKDKPIKVTVRTYVPTRDHPKFNFVGKLLGPKGNSLKRLQEETLTKMAILGRGSMRDKHKEEECRHSQEPRYKHLNDDLHVEITAYAAPAEAHARIALALTEIRRFLVPDYNDDIRQEQLREMQMMNAGMTNCNAAGGSSNSSSNDVDNSATNRSHSAAGSANPNGLSSLANPLNLSVALGGGGVGAATLPNGLTSPLRAVAYPPVLPLMHPALRGLCKPGQALTIGHLTPGSPLLSRFRPNVLQSVAAAAAAAAAAASGHSGSALNLNRRGPSAMVGRHGKLKDDYSCHGDSSHAEHHVNGVLELYNRYNLPYEGSDGVASPDDREEAEDLLASTNVTTDFQMLSESSSLKLTAAALERSRFRHEPYARYATKVIT